MATQSMSGGHGVEFCHIACCMCCCPLYWASGCFCETDAELSRVDSCVGRCIYCYPAISCLRTSICCFGYGCLGFNLDEDGFSNEARDQCRNELPCALAMCPLACPFFWVIGCLCFSNPQLLEDDGGNCMCVRYYGLDCLLCLRLTCCCFGRSICGGSDFYGVNATDTSGSSALSAAARMGNKFAMWFLRSLFCADIRIETREGNSVLLEAARKQRLSVMENLIKLGLDPYKENKVGLCACDFIDDPSILLADSTCVRTMPLYFACKYNLIDQAKKLVASGADVNARRRHGESATPLEIACAHGGSLELLQFMHSCGTKFDGIELHNACKRQECNFTLIYSMLEMGSDVARKDRAGKGALDLFPDSFECECGTSKRTFFLVRSEFSLQLLEMHKYSLWFCLISLSNAEVPGISQRVLYYVKKFPLLASAQDVNLRTAIAVATKENREMIESVLLVHGKFSLLEERPEHTSSTCVVFKAAENNHTHDNFKQAAPKVALKLMKIKSQFLQEVRARQQYSLSSEYVISVLECHPSPEEAESSWPETIDDVDISDTFTKGVLSKDDAEKLFCIVMPFADRNLFVSLKQDPWSGQVKLVFSHLVNCVKHLHEQSKHIHGDIKPMNIMRTNSIWNLIDLDAACYIGIDSVGKKYSSAYVPPEAVYIDKMSGIAMIGCQPSNKSTSSVASPSQQLLLAHPSFDVWSLGCILYQMSNRSLRPLFIGDRDDNLSLTEVAAGAEDSLLALAEWSNETKARKLSLVDDPKARSLLFQMLSKNPDARPSLANVLDHPFLSGKNVKRMTGEEAHYDVFISYRVASDGALAEKLFHLLKDCGLRVWYDKFCLQPGALFDEQFCDGLVSSACFISLLSREAINCPGKSHQNYSLLSSSSRLDSVLLEQMLALELHSVGLMERVMPIFIGDLMPPKDSSDVFRIRSNFFASNCLPNACEASVLAVEAKVEENMSRFGLGLPGKRNKTVKETLSELTSFQGFFVEGEEEAALRKAAAKIALFFPQLSSQLQHRRKSGQPMLHRSNSSNT